MNHSCRSVGLLRWLCLLWLIAVQAAYSHGVHAHESVKPAVNVMVLHGEWIESPWESQLNQHLYEALSLDEELTVNVTYEYLGLNELPQAVASSQTLAYLRQKADTRPIHLVVAVLPLASDFLLAYGDRLFPEVPRIFVVPGADRHSDTLSQTGVVLIPSSEDIGGNLERIFAVLPDTQQLVIVSGSHPKDLGYLSRARDALEANPPDPSVELRHLVGLPLEELLTEVEQLPERSVIMFLNYARDDSNRTYITANMIAPFCERANAPVFGFYDTLLGKGIVGGYLTSAEFYGKKTAEMGLQILHGTPPSQLPPIGKVTVDLYDWRQLRRWGIPEGRLPPDSIVRHKTLAFWDAYKIYILAAIIVIIGEVVLIAALITVLSRRRQAERRLSEQERYVSAIVTTTPALIYVYDMDSQSNVYANKGIEQLLGYTPAEALAMGESLFPTIIHPEDLEHVMSSQQKVMGAADGEVLQVEYRSKHRDGHWVFLRSHEQPFLRDPRGRVAQNLGVAIDITERKQANQALRESAAKYRKLFESESDAILLFDAETHRFEDANPASLSLYGYTHEEFLGLTVQEISAEPDQTQEMIARMVAGDADPLTSVCYHKKKDGTVFPAEISSGLFFVDGRRKIVSALRDITESKRAEEVIREQITELRALSVRLNDVEKSERLRLTRALHDQVGQNLAALGINLSIMKRWISQESPPSVLHDRLADSVDLVVQTTECIRNLITDLRPPVLDDYGLLPALRWHATRVSSRTGLDISVQGEKMTQRLASHIEDTLFRIVEEGLTNVIRHAEAAHVLLVLESEGPLVRLTIADDGIGFSLERQVGSDAQRGWGLAIMRERAEAIGAYICVESGSGEGTRVIVEVSR